MAPPPSIAQPIDRTKIRLVEWHDAEVASVRAGSMEIEIVFRHLLVHLAREGSTSEVWSFEGTVRVTRPESFTMQLDAADAFLSPVSDGACVDVHGRQLVATELLDGADGSLTLTSATFEVRCDGTLHLVLGRAARVLEGPPPP